MMERTLPHNLDAERSVLGAALLYEDLLALVSDSLAASDFFRAAHRMLYGTMLTLAEKRTAVDLLTVRDALSNAGQLEECGGPAYITGLTDGIPKSTNIEHYAAIVREKAMLRELIYAANKVLTDAYAADEDAAMVLAGAEGAIYGIGERATAGSLVDGPRMAQEGFALVERLHTTGRLVGLPTGLLRLDEAMLGLHRKHLTVIAARPGNGKSALMLHIARQLGMAQQKPVAVFSLEMSREENILRMMATESGMDGHGLNQGHVSQAQFDRLSHALNKIGGSQIYVDDTAGRTILQIRSLCRRLKSKTGVLGAVLIDYLQLMTPVKQSHSREQDVSQMAWGAKMLGERPRRAGGAALAVEPRR
jgi:replicative DNA helicase